MSRAAEKASRTRPYLIVLGIAQDAGYPAAGCTQACCQRAWRDPDAKRFATCIAIVDPLSSERWLLDCTPDFREQLHLLNQLAPPKDQLAMDGILLTHAHVGHYAGLVHLGPEAMDTRNVRVYAMPRLHQFLEANGPWNQLVRSGNIALSTLMAGEPVMLNDRVRATPFLVPHREEYSEAVVFRIDGAEKSAVYLPDIDSWDRWETRIEDLISAVDVAYLDGTFYDDKELPNRDMSAIPHPHIKESIKRFSLLPAQEKDKIHFIHLNHTNPALDQASNAAQAVIAAGFRFAAQGERYEL